jgi:IS5 family transposase
MLIALFSPWGNAELSGSVVIEARAGDVVERSSRKEPTATQRQIGFAEADSAGRRRVTRRQRLLAEMGEVIPWLQLRSVTGPYDKAERRPTSESMPIRARRIACRAQRKSCFTGMKRKLRATRATPGEDKRDGMKGKPEGKADEVAPSAASVIAVVALCAGGANEVRIL